MSYPSYLDLVFGSEKVTADPIGRLSFGKPVVVGDKIIFRSSTYSVSNDYIMSPNIDEPGWYPSFNDETIKNAYTQVEFNKEDLDTLGDINIFYGLFRNYLFEESQTQPSSQNFSSFFVFEIPEDSDIEGIIIMSNETNYDDPLVDETPSSLITLFVNVILYQYNDDDSETFSKSIPCTVSTFIEGVENKDPSYIPVLRSNSDRVISVDKVREFKFTHRTCTFPVLVETSNTGSVVTYDLAKAYFEVEVESDNTEAKNEILNNSVFYYAKGKSYVIGLRTDLKKNYSEDYSYYGMLIFDPIINGSSVCSGDLYLDHIYDGESHQYDIGVVYFRLVNAETHLEITNALLDYETDGTALIKL